MSEHEKDSILNCLFSGNDMKLRNVRFFRGGSDVIEAADFRAEVHAIATQRRTGGAKQIGWPKSERPKVDLHKFVADN
jgi:hypothetical protein